MSQIRSGGMRFYKQQHQFYCGVDLHAKTMHVCVVNQAGDILVHRNLPTRPDRFLNAIAIYRRHDLVVGVATNLRSVPDVQRTTAPGQSAGLPFAAAIRPPSF